jgi:hypothetical protein
VDEQGERIRVSRSLPRDNGDDGSFSENETSRQRTTNYRHNKQDEVRSSSWHRASIVAGVVDELILIVVVELILIL